MTFRNQTQFFVIENCDQIWYKIYVGSYLSQDDEMLILVIWIRLQAVNLLQIWNHDSIILFLIT